PRGGGGVGPARWRGGPRRRLLHRPTRGAAGGGHRGERQQGEQNEKRAESSRVAQHGVRLSSANPELPAPPASKPCAKPPNPELPWPRPTSDGRTTSQP